MRLMRLRGLMRPRGPMGLIGPMGLMGLMGLMGCSSGSDDVVPTPAPTPAPVEEMAISFNSGLAENEAVTRSIGNKNRAMSNVTRATTPLHEKGINTFTVWGYKNMSYNEGTGVYGNLQKVMPEYTVNWQENSANTTTSNTNGWEYVAQETGNDPEQTIKYWDWNAKAYRFFGVTNWGGTPPVPPAAYEANKTYGADGNYGADGTYWTAGAYKTYEITMTADCSGASEEAIAANIAATPYFTTLWFSTGNVGDYPDKQFGKPVQLEFLKPYARVRFLFKYAYPREGIKLGTKSFKPTTDGDKIARKGTVTVHYPTEGPEIKEWYTMAAQTGTGSEELDEFTVDYDPEDDGKNYVTLSSGEMTSDGWYIVLPNNTQGSYTLSVTVNGESKTAVMPKQYMQWLPGYSYTYVFKITDEGGVEIGWVEYAITPWTDLEADRKTYNW